MFATTAENIFSLYFVTTNILKESKFTLHVSRLSSRDLRTYPGHTTSLQKQNSELVNPLLWKGLPLLFSPRKF